MPSITCASPQDLLSGIILFRTSSVVAWRDSASEQPASVATRGMAGATPDVEMVTLRGGTTPPREAVITSAAALTDLQLSRGSPCPMNTTLVTAPPSGPLLVGVGPGKRPRSRRAAWSCPTISPGRRFRRSRCVPVWQNRQESAQPTDEDTQRTPLPSDSGMNTVSTSLSSWPTRNSHFLVPSADTESITASGSERSQLSATTARACGGSISSASAASTPSRCKAVNSAVAWPGRSPRSFKKAVSSPMGAPTTGNRPVRSSSRTASRLLLARGADTG
mmetsp:Transcript_21424/g.81653  ORF Transcript_21424/g.81653 Transcript_21424/m.81653 type:complete len:277 (+) Transcript_21424:561-1391(+)